MGIICFTNSPLLKRLENFDIILGVASGLMGEKAAMACTDAVEEAIVDHYNELVFRVKTSHCCPLKTKITETLSVLLTALERS